MSAILDDMDSRPGSATSLLRTAIGLYLRELGGWISAAHLVRLLDVLGIPTSSARTAITRVRQKGVLTREAHDGVAGYRLQPDALRMLQRGDRRIFQRREMSDHDDWCLVSFSVPEDQRSLRYQLRRRLHWIGCGAVSASLWICRTSQLDEVEEILVDLQLRSRATLFVTGDPRPAKPLSEAVAEWWDLDAIRALHDDFLDTATPLLKPERGTDPGRHAFFAYLTAIDGWRIIPYLDPGLRTDLLPADWPGQRSSALFEQIGTMYAEPARRFVVALQ